MLDEFLSKGSAIPLVSKFNDKVTSDTVANALYKLTGGMDQGYIDYIKRFPHPVGLFSNTIQLFGAVSSDSPLSGLAVNSLLREKFHFVGEKYWSFGQDLFGHQYVFLNNTIQFFNIETGSFTFLANSFLDWIDLVLSDVVYFSGGNIIFGWQEANSKLLNTFARLAPIKPFVLGGKYAANNLFELHYSTLLAYMSSIAIQLYNVPDGQVVSLKIIPPTANFT